MTQVTRQEDRPGRGVNNRFESKICGLFRHNKGSPDRNGGRWKGVARLEAEEALGSLGCHIQESGRRAIR